jgi:hypothetical protein
LIKNNIDRFLLIYATILSAINLFIIISWLVPFNYSFFVGIFQWVVAITYYSFIVIYIVELIISIKYIRNCIIGKNILKIIPQIILSLFYLFIFIILFFESGWLILFGLPILLAAISLFFSHLFVTGYFQNRKIIIFWRIMSSLTSVLIFYSVFRYSVW